MAIARCVTCGKPKSTKLELGGIRRQPSGPLDPKSGLVCGRPICENPALIWLKMAVATDYEFRGGPRNSDRLLRWDPDRGEGVWNATEETELSG